MTSVCLTFPVAATVVFIVVLLNPLAAAAVVWHVVVSLVATWVCMHVVGAVIGMHWSSLRFVVGVLADISCISALCTTCTCAVMLAYEDASTAMPEYPLEQQLSWDVALTSRMVLTSWCVVTIIHSRSMAQRRCTAAQLIRWGILFSMTVLALLTNIAVLADTLDEPDVIQRCLGAKLHADVHRVVSTVLLVAAVTMLLEVLEIPLIVLCMVCKVGVEACRSGGITYYLLEATCVSSLLVALAKLAVCVVLAAPAGGWGSGTSVPMLLQLMILHRLYRATEAWKTYWAFHSLLDAFEEKRGGVRGDFGDSCRICLESMHPGESVRELPCRHMFHSRCIHHSLIVNRTCPLCRQDPWALLMQQRQDHSDEEDAPVNHVEMVLEPEWVPPAAAASTFQSAPAGGASRWRSGGEAVVHPSSARGTLPVPVPAARAVVPTAPYRSEATALHGTAAARGTSHLHPPSAPVAPQQPAAVEQRKRSRSRGHAVATVEASSTTATTDGQKRPKKKTRREAPSAPDAATTPSTADATDPPAQ